MPLATAADIALGTRAQEVRTNEDASIKTRFPTRARDGNTRPDNGYFDLKADCDTVLAARRTLLGAYGKGRFAIEVDGLIWYDPIAYAGVRLVDAEKAVDAVFAVARWQVDCEAERTRFELFA